MPLLLLRPQDALGGSKMVEVGVQTGRRGFKITQRGPSPPLMTAPKQDEMVSRWPQSDSQMSQVVLKRPKEIPRCVDNGFGQQLVGPFPSVVLPRGPLCTILGRILGTKVAPGEAKLAPRGHQEDAKNLKAAKQATC